MYETPRHNTCEQGKSTAMSAAECSPGMLAAVKCGTPHAEQAALAMVTPCKVVKTAGGESRQVAAVQKQAAAYSDEPDLKEAMDSIHRDRWLEAMRDELASLTENGVYELFPPPRGCHCINWEMGPEDQARQSGRNRTF